MKEFECTLIREIRPYGECDVCPVNVGDCMYYKEIEDADSVISKLNDAE